MISTNEIFKEAAARELKKLWPEWTIESVIGAGAFGQVYRIVRDLNGKKLYCALKVIHVDLDAQQEEQTAFNYTREVRSGFNQIEKAISEISIMEELKGAYNVVRIEDFKLLQEDNEALIMIRMELLQSLTGYVQQYGFPDPSMAARIGIDICRALEFCQSKQIIHRDIKPANLFVDEYGNFKLGDFGIAREFDMHRMSGNMTMIGTVSYMAPEIYKGEAYTDSVDTYSLGLVLYELLNYGRMPFLPPYPQRITEEDVSYAGLRRTRGEKFGPPAGADSVLGQIICKACSFHPEDRYQSAREFRNALEGYLNGSTVYSTETAAITRGDRRDRLMPLLIGTAGLLCLVIVVSCVLLLQESRPSGGFNAQEDVYLSTEETGEQETGEETAAQMAEEDIQTQETEEPGNSISGYTASSGDSTIVVTGGGSEELEQIAEPEESSEDIDIGQPYDFFTYGGHSYAFYDVSMIDTSYFGNVTNEAAGGFRHVEAFCESMNGHLAVIESVDENREIFRMVTSNFSHTVFFGLSDEDGEGDWTWVDGSPDHTGLWSFKAGVQQPDNGQGYGSENYAEYDYDRYNPEGSDNTGLWNDAEYLKNTTVFVCEWDHLIEGGE